jgi:AcrR family transcriptional regulator
MGRAVFDQSNIVPTHLEYMTKASPNVRRAEIGEAKRARTRIAILTAAMDVLGSEEGRFARVDEVMAKAAMARGTFYNYFDSRDDLIEALAYEISHAFNTAMFQVVDRAGPPAARTAMGVRHYLHKARLDHQWGWAVVNISMNSPKLFGEETFNEVSKSIADGCKSGAFKLDDPEAGTDMLLGTVLTALIKILQHNPVPEYEVTTTMLILRALGISNATATRLASLPLVELPPYETHFGASNSDSTR